MEFTNFRQQFRLKSSKETMMVKTTRNSSDTIYRAEVVEMRGRMQHHDVEISIRTYCTDVYGTNQASSVMLT